VSQCIWAGYGGYVAANFSEEFTVNKNILREAYMNRIFHILVICTLLSLCACSNLNKKTSDSTDTKTSIIEKRIENQDNNLNEILKQTILNSRVIMNSQNDILKIKQFSTGYLVLMLHSGDGSGITLNYLENIDNDSYKIKGFSSGELAISMGFGVNRLVLENSTIFFCNLNESTWVPENDTRNETNYEKMIFEFDNGDKMTENVKNDKGYIVIVNNKVNIKSIKLYNEDNDLVNTYEDIGKTNESEFIKELK